MRKLFQNVPVEKGTRIHFEEEMNIGEIHVLYQMWSWDGVRAESVVFQSHDVQNLSDVEVQEFVKKKFADKLQIEGAMTISRSSSGFTFVNFNFTL